ncbi:YfcE family phosphodiesterase [Pseudoflavonifractor sp. BIOML-A6]|nr:MULTISPECIES: metallophosphoesterase [unclassified Pseudoflavonifractor]MTQ97224.1 YfcE family phosphodiesterase [Pseudoflavonifractor sp. BIOML-A16]MTR05262.1 YfcE family phosphodiesterase [Pseudoflavonifractor sp. BIOML-A15]MTR31529.1 YfcE family phosphodiesterase [Pseudoflavonifractor sp. BIOML-A14]MTR72215.1 YfcE family phosphodiesterase [Pseudoflavonifractor sp. BIOML-A18]MTS63045.1 YfcE family phosphodiesterase [Pseudoflavonifractor sp. BIOML-A5]MTS70617.1 YfcE family phosphodiestera
MKLLVFSDSHGNTSNMCAAVERERPDRILHLGDMVRDAVSLAGRFPEIPLDMVPGNCDYSMELSVKKLLEAEGRRILMTHGHIYSVKAGIGTAVLAAREAGADILLFGHTHEPLCDFYDGLWILNPGSCRGGLRPTYGVISLTEGKTYCRTAELNDGRMG